MSKLPEAIEPIIDRLSYEIMGIKQKKKIFYQLFVEDGDSIKIQEKISLLTNFALDFFLIVQESLIKDIVISIISLVDDGRDVISLKDTFKNNINDFNHAFFDDLGNDFSAVVSDSISLKNARDRYYAHISRDNIEVMNPPINILEEIEKILPKLESFINKVTQYFDLQIGFDDSALRGDGNSIINYLMLLNEQRNENPVSFREKLLAVKI